MERMPSHPPLPPKKDVALALLEQSSVFIHLDPRDDAVRVPVSFKKQPQLVLQIGLNMPIPIPDLEVGDDGVSCTLSFSRTPHACWIPWSSVFALVGDSGRGMVWPDDVPREVAAQAGQQAPQKKPPLRAVASEAEPTPARIESKGVKPKKKRARKPAAPKDAAARKPARAETRTAASRSSSNRAKPKVPEAAPARGVSAGGASASSDQRRRALPPYLRVIK